MTTLTVNPVIPAGESLSDAVDCSTGQIVRLTMPAEWTPANLTFQVGDGNTFSDLYDLKGEETTLRNLKPGVSVALHGTLPHPLGFVKIRSGTRSHPVPQQAQQQFAVTINTAVAVD